MAKRKTKTSSGRKPKMVSAVVFDGLKQNQLFNVGADRSFAPGEVCICELDGKKKPKDKALRAALNARSASLTQVPDPAAQGDVPEEVS